MEEQVKRLVKDTWKHYESLPPNARFLVGISGIPGSGKTTLASKVTSSLNKLAHGSEIATYVPMDGYHYTRAQLSAMDNPEEAIARRGAAFTFDGEAFLSLVKKVREPLSESEKGDQTIYAPSFDHAIKDPVADDIKILKSARVVIFEGNYLSLSTEPWKSAGKLMDKLWFVEINEDVARERLAQRHVRAGIVESYEDGVKRANENDLRNGREIIAGRVNVDEVIKTVEDKEWKHE